MEYARFGRRLLTDPVAVSTDLADLDGGGLWALVVTFEGEVTAVRFARARDVAVAPVTGRWVPPGEWSSSMTKGEYLAGVERVREHVAAGTVYQVNLCRVLTAPLAPQAHLPALAAVLEEGNPAPFAGLVHVPSAGLDVVCASPEAYLLRDGERAVSRPIKGTGRVPSDLGAKDHAENVMITDLVRNDLSRVALPGSVDVEALCALEEHPGLLHLTSDVAARLRPGVGWAELVGATFPPGSVSGAPRSAALQVIRELEPVPRGPYCGAVGWLDADARRGELAVAIRTFWAEQGPTGRDLRFGTGAGVTWGSVPQEEWRETELKAGRLVGLSSGRVGS